MNDLKWPEPDQDLTCIVVYAGNVHLLASRVKVVRDDALVLALDIAPEDIPALAPGAPVTLIYPGGDSMLRLKGRVARVPEPGLLDVTTIGSPTAGERREFIRADADMPCFVDALTATSIEAATREQEAHPVAAEDPAWTVRQVDISGNGAAFDWDRLVAKGDLIDLRFKIPSRRAMREVATIGRVVRVKKAASGFSVAVHFETIDDETQNRLFSFVMTRYYAQIYKKLASHDAG